MKRLQIFIVTFLCSAAFNGQGSVFAMIKSPMSSQFHLSSTFLGFLDAISQLGSFFGCFFVLLFPFKKPKLSYFYFVALMCLFTMSLLLGRLMGSGIYLFFPVILFCLGLLKGPVFCPTLIMSQYFNPNSESFYVNFWMGLASFGEGIPFLSGKLMMGMLGWDWSVYLLICCIFFAGVGLWLLLRVDEVQTHQDGSEMKKVSEKIQRMRRIMLEKRKSWLIIDLIFLQTFFYNVILWYPYYFTTISYANYAEFMTIIFCITFVLGTFLFETGVKILPISSDTLVLVSLALLTFLQFFSLILNLHDDESGKNAFVYMMLSATSGFLVGGPYSKLASSETIEIAEGNNTELYFILGLQNLLKALPSFVFLFSIGYCIERNKSWMFVLLLLNAIICLFLDICWRKLYKPKSQEDYSQINQ